MRTAKYTAGQAEKPNAIALHSVPGTTWFITVCRERQGYSVGRGCDMPGIGPRQIRLSVHPNEETARKAANTAWLALRPA